MLRQYGGHRGKYSKPANPGHGGLMMTAVLVGALVVVVTAGMTAWTAWAVGRAATAWKVDSGATDTAPVATRRQAS